jgi:hypothetical protein
MSRRVKPMIDHAFAVPLPATRGEPHFPADRRKRFLLRRRMEWWLS